MNFNIKDVKSWANRHDVKVGDKGYFFENIPVALDKEKDEIRTGIITEIKSDRADCFLGVPQHPTCRYHFFLPLDKVKEDKFKEKKYRPLRTEDDLRKLLGVTFDIGKYSITYRSKKSKCIFEEYIYSIIKNQNNELEEINGVFISALYVNFEIYINNKWVPFGVEIENKE